MIGILVLTITSLVCSIVLVLTDKYLHTKTEKITSLLPGYNCNGCGFGSCAGMAQELLKNPDAIDKCRPIKEEEALKLKEYIKSIIKK